MKYKIIKSDIFLNGRIIPENSEVDLSESDIKGIEDYLILLAKEVHSEPDLSDEKSPTGHSDPDLSGEESLNTKTEQKNKTKRGNK